MQYAKKFRHTHLYKQTSYKRPSYSYFRHIFRADKSEFFAYFRRHMLLNTVTMSPKLSNYHWAQRTWHYS